MSEKCQIRKMGLSNSKAEEREILDNLVPRVFRHCITDLSTEHLTDSEKAKIDRYVWTFAQTYLRTKERVAEQFLLSEYSDYLYG